MAIGCNSHMVERVTPRSVFASSSKAHMPNGVHPRGRRMGKESIAGVMITRRRVTGWDSGEGSSQERRSRSLVLARAAHTKDEWDEALRMCAEILQEATKLAEQEARAELMAAFKLDAVESSWDEDLEAETSFQEPEKPLVIALLELRTFWQSVGMADLTAERLSKELIETDSPYVDVELLTAKFDRLTRTLPDVNITELVKNDVEVLRADTRLVVMRLLELYSAFEETDIQVHSVIQYCPKLLYFPNFLSAFNESVEAIQYIFPRLEREWVVTALGEEPEMLFMLPKYQVRKNMLDISELPMDVQNVLSFSTRQKYAF
mmetsp:Transcript_1417/g.2016  ORF Transcript_1417/g.2016 Transcript_1417/m.2016 type:complete len:319 (+) Transcript_1417:53-1009(+)